MFIVGSVVLVGFSFNIEMPASQRGHLSLCSCFSPSSRMLVLVLFLGCGACGEDRMEVSQFFLCSLNLRWPCAHGPRECGLLCVLTHPPVESNFALYLWGLGL